MPLRRVFSQIAATISTCQLDRVCQSRVSRPEPSVKGSAIPGERRKLASAKAVSHPEQPKHSRCLTTGGDFAAMCKPPQISGNSANFRKPLIFRAREWFPSHEPAIACSSGTVAAFSFGQ